jgi:hypothetical protein
MQVISVMSHMGVATEKAAAAQQLRLLLILVGGVHAALAAVAILASIRVYEEY